MNRLSDLPTNRRNMNILWIDIKAAVLAANKCVIPQVWISPQQKDKRPFDQPPSFFAARKVGSFLLRLKDSNLQTNRWPEPLEWSHIKNNMDKLITDLKLPTCSFPLALQPDNINDIKIKIKDLYKSLIALAKIETQKIQELTIKSFINKRCDNLQDDLSKMIASILNQKKRSIVLDRLLITDKESGDKHFTIEPEEIKSATINHFQNFAVPSTPAYPMPPRWSEQYKPKDYVNEQHYTNLMQPPTYDEWLAVIRTLPNNKAAGPSGITNEMIAHLGDKLQRLLWKLICMCFTIGDIPNEWKIAHIYPIPKPMEWECDITKTRPITLLETA